MQTCLQALYALNGAPVHKTTWAARTEGVHAPGWGGCQACDRAAVWSALEGRQQSAAAGQLAGGPPWGQACLGKGALSE